jgi:hypothetical protein
MLTRPAPSRRAAGVLGLWLLLSPLPMCALIAQEVPAVERLLRTELAGLSAMAWDPGRPLVWTDFTATPPQSSEWAALTYSGLRAAYHCDATRVQFGVLAYFQPSESWARPQTVKNRHQSAVVLPHEQGHFDLAEISARQLRQELGTLQPSCASLDTTFSGTVSAALARTDALQNRYDAETAHGTLAPAQARWREWITVTLDALSPVASPWISRTHRGE